MTTRDKIQTALQACNVPFADGRFDEPQIPPFAILSAASENLYDDLGRTCLEMEDLVVELYVANLEEGRRFEIAMREQYLKWDKFVPTWIDDELMFMIRYEFEG